MKHEIIQNLLGFFMLLSGFGATFSKKTIHSVIFLIITFFFAACLLFYFSLEFLGLVMIIIYVGAIAILFLFVVMMLNEKGKEFSLLDDRFTFFAFLAYFLVGILCLFVEGEPYTEESFHFSQTNINQFVDGLTNIDIIGQIFFNYMNLAFLIAGLILLLALLGSIILTFEFNNLQKDQQTFKQLSRNRNTLIF